MADNRIQMPSSGGGLTTFSEGFHSKIQIRPGTIVFWIILAVIIEFLLHQFGGGLI